MNLAHRRERYRAVLAGERCVRPASVFDPLSARIASDLGYEAGMLAGSVASMTVLGAPDLLVLTLSELAAQVHRICRASDLPLMVDADHGYGNALNVMRTVEELESAGVCGLSLEDTDLPQPYGAAGKSRLISVEEGVGKMRAALRARQDPDLVILGRTSAVPIAGVDDAIRRVSAYARAGVDGIFLVGVRERDELEAVRAAVDLPLVLGGISGRLEDEAYLAAQGVRVALKSHAPFMAAVKAVHDTLAALRQGVPPSELEGVAEAAFMKRVTRSSDHDTWMGEYL